MRLLADENIRRDLVDWLRDAGHDIVWVAEHAAGEPDQSILDLANREDRAIISADLDFGEMVIRQRMHAPGLLLLRLGTLPSIRILQVFQQHWARVEPHLKGRIVVLDSKQIRIRPLL